MTENNPQNKLPSQEETDSSINQLVENDQFREESTEKIASVQMEALVASYELSLKHASTSFRLAVILAILGIIFLLATAVFVLQSRINLQFVVVAITTSIVTEIVAGIVFFLYRQAQKRVFAVHDQLTNTQQTLLDYSIGARPGSSYSDTVNRGIERLSKADPEKVQEVVAAQIGLMSGYFQEVLDQSRRSFRMALIAASIGFILFIIAIVFVFSQRFPGVEDAGSVGAIVSAIGGALAEFIAAINFRLYGAASTQLAEFQSRLDTTQRFLLANSISASLDGDMKQKAQWELVRTIAQVDKARLQSTQIDAPTEDN